MIKRIQKYFKSLILSYKKIPDKKVYVEFITAVLSIPVLLTVILLNVNNLKNQTAPKTDNKTVGEKIIYVTSPPVQSTKESDPVVTSSACKEELPPVTIDSPDEGDTVTDNPVCFDISYKKADYCSIVWSYRINNGPWSDYDDKSVCLYNLPSGPVKFDLKVKSIATGDETTLHRNFTYNSSTTVVTPTMSEPPTSSSSATTK